MHRAAPLYRHELRLWVSIIRKLCRKETLLKSSDSATCCSLETMLSSENTERRPGEGHREDGQRSFHR